VARVVEKPRTEDAAALIAQGALWNCGVFAFRLGWMSELTAGYSDAASFEELRARYAELPKNSFDYEVVERCASVAVIPCAAEWKDLGTWNTLAEEMADPCSGRAVVDWGTCSNVHVVNETGLPLAVAGLRDSVVVATPDGILVSGKAESAQIKRVVEEARAARPMYERRVWGEYRVLDSSVYPDGRRALTKELAVEVGKQLSYQRHASRSEVWTVVSGEGEVVLDGEARRVAPGDVVCVPAGTLHALRAFTEVRIVEVQLGEVLVEEDIERFGHFWSEA
jgi:mannose-1-phosphate guanylyltransferase